MVEVSRNGQRVDITTRSTPRGTTSSTREGVGAWVARIDANTEAGEMTLNLRFSRTDDFRGLRVHQTRLQGGDASSDSYCFVE